MIEKKLRPIKVLMSGQLVDQMDAVLQAGLGGIRTRHKLIEEALQYYIDELTDASNYDPDKDTISPQLPEPQSRLYQPPQPSDISELNTEETGSERPAFKALENKPALLEITKDFAALDDLTISGSVAEPTINQKLNISQPTSGPLLGLHNRDWTSIQALDFLGKMTSEGTVLLSDFLNVATANAWLTFEKLSRAEQKGVGKLTALLPSNPKKAKTTEGNYRNFAIGWVGKGVANSPLQTSGPLFAWSCVGLEWKGGLLHIGLTESGSTLVKGLNGLSPIAPHDSSLTTFFLQHLSKYGYSDWSYLIQVLQALEKKPTRMEILEAAKSRMQVNPSAAASTVQGYLARGREWGLVEPKMIDNRYLLTTFGKNYIEQHKGLSVPSIQQEAN